MPIPMSAKKPLIILASAVAIGVLIGGGYLVYKHFWGPKPVPISTYLCPDGSHYVVIKYEEEIIVSGNTFARVEETSRYSNGAFEIDLTPETFALRDLATNEEVANCIAGIPEAGLPPILTEQQ